MADHPHIPMQTLERYALGELAPAERAEYEAERAVYRGFVEQHGIRMTSPTGWAEFIRKSCGSDAGRRPRVSYLPS